MHYEFHPRVPHLSLFPLARGFTPSVFDAPRHQFQKCQRNNRRKCMQRMADFRSREIPIHWGLTSGLFPFRSTLRSITMGTAPENGPAKKSARTPVPSNPWQKMEEAKRQHVDNVTPTTPLLSRAAPILSGYERQMMTKRARTSWDPGRGQ